MTNFGHNSRFTQNYNSRLNRHCPSRLNRSTNFLWPTHARNFLVTPAEKYGTSMFIPPTATLTGGSPTGPQTSGWLVAVELVGSSRRSWLVDVVEALIGAGGRNGSAGVSSSIRSVMSPNRFSKISPVPRTGGFRVVVLGGGGGRGGSASRPASLRALVAEDR